MHPPRTRTLVTAVLSCAIGCALPGPAARHAPQLTHGIAIGEVTQRAATIWARCSEPGAVRVEVASEHHRYAFDGIADGERDRTARVAVEPLESATEYVVQVRCGSGEPFVGTFATAPNPTEPSPVRFTWGGDIGGQNVCRDTGRGYPIFAVIAEDDSDFFIGLGDMVYADDPCRAIGRYGNDQITGPAPASTVGEYHDHWKYARADPELQQLLASTPYFTVWDDHEIRNDSGPDDDRPNDAGEIRLLPLGRQAFLDYQPWRDPVDASVDDHAHANDHADDHEVMYRAVRWGRHLEMFLLDTRQYRERNDLPDTALEAKTMLGATQREWLLDAISHSDATWKIIVSSVPLSIPTGRGPAARDGWADDGGQTGFEREAALILDALRAMGAGDTIFVTTDVHFATGFEYRPFFDAPDFAVHEFVTGPLNAGVFPRRDLDPTFSPRRLFLWGPEGGSIASFDDALQWFNYGRIDIDADGLLTVRIVNARGETVWHTTLTAPDVE